MNIKKINLISIFVTIRFGRKPRLKCFVVVFSIPVFKMNWEIITGAAS